MHGLSVQKRCCKDDDKHAFAPTEYATKSNDQYQCKNEVLKNCVKKKADRFGEACVDFPCLVVFPFDLWLV